MRVVLSLRSIEVQARRERLIDAAQKRDSEIDELISR